MADSAPRPMPEPGNVIDGKYRLDAYVGSGAMGSVFRAQHLALGHSVAIKFLSTAHDQPAARARFVREARATMTLRSEHVVRVFDLGFSADQLPYMVLELLDGVDLRSLLTREGALLPERAVDYVLQVCEALAEAHLHGIVHRDLKPQNLFLVRRPDGSSCLKLLDFGVSKFEELGHDVELTSSQLLLGSPAFMPPEQIRSSSTVDARADIWSLGVVLYMLLGGGRPFAGDGLTSLCASIMVDPPRPLAHRCPGVVPALEQVLFRCLEKSRDRRYANVAAVALALEPFASAAGRASSQRVQATFAAVPVRHVPMPLDVRQPGENTGSETASDPRDTPSVEATIVDAWPTHARRSRPWALVAIAAAVGASALVVAARPRPHHAAPATELARLAASAPASVAAPPSVSAPAPSSSAPTAPPRTQAHKPVSSPKASRAPQRAVDRNGVPILD